jgi:hypothetical protein
MRKIERYPTDKYKEGKIHILMWEEKKKELSPSYKLFTLAHK